MSDGQVCPHCWPQHYPGVQTPTSDHKMPAGVVSVKPSTAGLAACRWVAPAVPVTGADPGRGARHTHCGQGCAGGERGSQHLHRGAGGPRFQTLPHGAATRAACVRGRRPQCGRPCKGCTGSTRSATMPGSRACSERPLEQHLPAQQPRGRGAADRRPQAGARDQGLRPESTRRFQRQTCSRQGAGRGGHHSQAPAGV